MKKLGKFAIHDGKKKRKLDTRARNKIQKKLAAVVNKSAILETEFPDLTPENNEAIRLLINDPSVVIGKYISHVWYENEIDQLYHGKVLSMQIKKKNNLVPVYTITYWLNGESEASSADSKLTLIEFLTDSYTSELVLFSTSEIMELQDGSTVDGAT